MFRIIFIRDSYDWGSGHGQKGFTFEPIAQGTPFKLCGHMVFPDTLYIFVTIQKNIFSTLEALFHEIIHLVIHTLIFHWRTAACVNWWYDYLYWKLLRLWHCN